MTLNVKSSKTLQKDSGNDEIRKFQQKKANELRQSKKRKLFEEFEEGHEKESKQRKVGPKESQQMRVGYKKSSQQLKVVSKKQSKQMKVGSKKLKGKIDKNGTGIKTDKKQKGPFEKPDWKKVKKEAKEMSIKRKKQSCGGEDMYNLIAQAKVIWEELRRNDCERTKKLQLCADLFNLIKKDIKSLIYGKDTVRIIQTLLAAGKEKYSTRLFYELKNDLLGLIKNKYAHFFILKLLKLGTKEQKDAIIQAMNGNIVKLMSHRIACQVLEIAYNDYATATQRSHMLQEFFGPSFKYFKEDIKTLKHALEKFPDKKEQILIDMGLALQPILDKGVFTNVLIHTVLIEYLQYCSVSDKRNIMESIREGLLPIIHTRDGAKVAMQCLWNGTPKDRKIIIKSFKNKYISIATEEYGHWVLLSIFDCVDDTQLIQKVILSELIAGINDLVKSKFGKKVLIYLVDPRNKMFIHPGVISTLEQGDGNPHSKKDCALRTSEIRNFVTEPILQLVHRNINEWVKDSHWTLYIGTILKKLSSDTIIPIFEAIAAICAEPFMLGLSEHFLEKSFMSSMVSYIIFCDKDRVDNGKPTFSPYLLAAAETEMPHWTLCNRGCVILSTLIDAQIPEVSSEILEICQPLKPKLPKRDFKWAQILLTKLK